LWKSGEHSDGRTIFVEAIAIHDLTISKTYAKIIK
jgi:hypothetical protein